MTIGTYTKTAYVNGTTPAISAGNLNNNEDKTSEIDVDYAAHKAESTTFDKIIKTQAQFETLIASSTWLDAVSVCFVGDGGTLKFTRSDGTGIEIPQTVKQIQGVNNAIIEVTNFVENGTTNKGGLWYATLPTTSDYSIDDLTVNCTGTGTGYGFYNCTQLTNCIGTGTGTGDGYYGYGFYNCTQLTTCTGTGTSTGVYYGYGFYNCTQLTNCIGAGTGTGDSYGFHSCTQLTNCTGTGTDGTNGYGFHSCTQFTNCTGTGTGTSDGYGFYTCHYISNCKAGAASTTALLGGTNTQVDPVTVA